MKLAEALLQRADTNNYLSRLGQRIAQNARVQEGLEPAEDPLQLLEEAVRILKSGEDLIVRINKVNLETTLANGMTMMEAIVRRGSLDKAHAINGRPRPAAVHVKPVTLHKQEPAIPHELGDMPAPNPLPVFRGISRLKIQRHPFRRPGEGLPAVTACRRHSGSGVAAPRRGGGGFL